VSKHLSIQGRPNPRGGLCCFWCPNKTLTPPLNAFDALKIVKTGLEMRKLHCPLNIEGSRTQKDEPQNTAKPVLEHQKFLVCSSIAIRVQR
jgi:hypothetical protein